MGFGKKVQEETDNTDLINLLGIKEITKKDLMLIGVNPRATINTEVINTLRDVEDIEPIKLGYCPADSTLEFEGKKLAGKYFLVDGEHRYRSRGDNDQLPCMVKHYDNILEILKDSVVFNLHGQRLKNEEIYGVIDKEINYFYLENGMDYNKIPNMKGISRTYRIDKSTSFFLTYLHVLKNKVENIDQFDCLKQKSLKKEDETFRKYIILALRELIKKEESIIKAFLIEFGPYIKNTTLGRQKELVDVVAGYIAGEYQTYQEYLQINQSAAEANVDVMSFLESQGVDSVEDIKDDEEIIGGKKSNSNLDLGLHVKKIATTIKQSIQTISILKGTNKSKLNLTFPEDADLEEIKAKAEQLIDLINELKK